MKTNSEVAQQKATVDPQTAQKILAITLAYNEASGNSDAAAIAALFTEDGLFVTDTGPVYGSGGHPEMVRRPFPAAEN
jgi:ketosteroid isomerase-like protein